MVNTGRPSPACKACRARRLKCDQTKPACIKCIKAKRVCPGYREPFEVNFRDQTQSTIRKHQRANDAAKRADSDRGRDDGGVSPYPSSGDEGNSAAARRRPVIKFDTAVSPDYSYSNGTSTSASSSCTTSPISPASSSSSLATPLDLLALQMPVEAQATCFFVTNFIAVQTMNLDGGMRFLEPLIKAARQGTAFHSAFMAASMASLASRPNSSALIPTARLYYNKALRQVSRVMADKNKLKEDESLAAIVMLILYEALMWDEQAQGSLRFHIHGAQAIVKLRGPEQRRRPVGYGMFEFIRAFMVHQYVHAPDYDSDDIKWWASEGSTDEPRHVLQRLNVEATLLRRQLGLFLQQGGPDKPAGSQNPVTAFRIYRKARKLDAQLAAWFRDIDVVWQRELDRWQDDVPDAEMHRAPAFPGKVYSFKNIWIASKFLNASTHRLILAEILFQIIDWIQAHGGGADEDNDNNGLENSNNNIIAGSMPTRRERDEAAAMARAQIAEIVSMVPYFTTWPNPACPSPYGAMSCSFQLYVAAASPCISRRQKAFIVGRLAQIAQNTGVKMAGKFAEVLRLTFASSGTPASPVVAVAASDSSGSSIHKPGVDSAAAWNDHQDLNGFSFSPGPDATVTDAGVGGAFPAKLPNNPPPRICIDTAFDSRGHQRQPSAHEVVSALDAGADGSGDSAATPLSAVSPPSPLSPLPTYELSQAPSPCADMNELQHALGGVGNSPINDSRSLRLVW